MRWQYRRQNVWFTAVVLASVLTGCTPSPQSRSESNWSVLGKYVHPDAQDSSRLVFGELIEESSNGTVYRVDLPLAELDRWYESQFSISLRDDFESGSGRVGIYFDTDAQYRDSMVFLLDTRVPEAWDALSELLSEKRIRSIGQEPGVIAVAFLDDPVEAIRMLRELNRTRQ